MSTVRHLFLDLEDTVITPVMDGWFNTHMINVPKVKKIMQQFVPHFVHLFSFAVWDQAQLLRFDQGTRPMLEQSLGTKLCTAWTVDDDIIPMCCKVMHLGNDSVDFSEMSNFWGKHEAFRLCMRHTFRDTHNHPDTDVEVMLLDDVVLNETFAWPDLKIKGHIINIDTPMEPWNAFDRTDNS